VGKGGRRVIWGRKCVHICKMYAKNIFNRYAKIMPVEIILGMGIQKAKEEWLRG
jgi:hypothetical protein